MRLVQFLAVPLLMLAAWHVAAVSGAVSPYLLPAPAAVFATAADMVSSGELARHLGASMHRISQGFFISISAGCIAAALLARFTLLEKLLDVPLSFLRMTPPLAVIPLLILWLGIGEATQQAIIILASFFPTFLNARAGFSRLDASFKELSASLHLSFLDYTRYLALPAAVPSIVTGIRLSFGYCWRALIAAELIAASTGLGYMITDAEQMQRVDEVMVGVFVIGLIGWALDSLFRTASSKLLGRRFPEVA